MDARIAPRTAAVHFGWVSLLQDLGSKMVVPIVPLFLALELGATPAVVGLIDGLGVVGAAASAAVIGRLGHARPLRFVRAGYGLSSVAKLALAFATSWPGVLGIRLGDRVGKGVRDAPRDALLARAPAGSRGTSFGVHQAMDKTGGFIGPLAGLAVYEIAGGSFDAVFVAAFVPCALSVALLWRLPSSVSDRPVRLDADDRRQPATGAQRRALVAVALHGAGFVSVSLLLLRALDAEASVAEALIGYSMLRLMTALASYPVGRLVDLRTPAAVVVTGMTISAAAIAICAVAPSPGIVWVGLAFVGLADAMTKGPVKAWLVSLGPAATHSSVLGDRSAIAGVAEFVSSLLVGLAWAGSGSTALLVAAGVAALGAMVAAHTAISSR